VDSDRAILRQPDAYGLKLDGLSWLEPYVLLGILGHGTMRLVAGPAAADVLARWPWKAA